MKRMTNLIKRTTLALGLSRAASAAAQEPVVVNETQMQEPAPGGGKNRFELRSRFQFNVKANFGGIGVFPAQNTAGAAVGAKVYDDGFVLDDPDGNTPSPGGPLTDNWQYQNASQVRVAGPATFLDMNISSATPTLQSNDAEGDVAPGFELVYSRELRSSGRAAWGLQGSLGYTRSNVRDTRGLAGNASVFTESYTITVPAAAVIASGPGAAPPPMGAAGTLIPVAPGAPVTTSVAGGALTTGVRELESDIVGMRLGPYLDYALSEKVSLSLGVGASAAVINSRFGYTESTTIPGMGPALLPGVSATQTSSGSVSDTEIQGGGYVDLSLSARLNDRWDATVGAQYQYTGRFRQRVDTHTASLNLEQSIGVFGGVRFKF
jgi:hypothetical protein